MVVSFLSSFGVTAFLGSSVFAASAALIRSPSRSWNPLYVRGNGQSSNSAGRYNPACTPGHRTASQISPPPSASTVRIVVSYAWESRDPEVVILPTLPDPGTDC